MKKLIALITITVLLVSCMDSPKKESTEIKEIKTEDITTSIYPESISKVFDAHGGIDQWNKMNTLSFTMDKPNGNEVTIVNLKTRAELIDTPTYKQGFNGDSIWILKKEESYKGNPQFYRGLMMYFYAMPFILGDDGIIYEEIEPLAFEDKTYPGILISYENGVGASPEDQYIIYYDENTGQMQWLAYTVTFGKDEKSKDFHFIRYNNWQNVNGLQVPKSIDWYNYEDGKPTTKRNTVEFNNVKLSKDSPDTKMFEKPNDAEFVE